LFTFPEVCEGERLKLRGDILAHPKHTGFVVTEDEMIECVPSSLFYVHMCHVRGESLFEGSQEEPEDIAMSRKESDTQRRVLSVAQDLLHNVIGGRHWTPKHIGLASTLHQATRSTGSNLPGAATSRNFST